MKFFFKLELFNYYFTLTMKNDRFNEFVFLYIDSGL